MPEPRKLSVFLCHASQDKPVVRELSQQLKREDWIDPWLDEEKLSPGQAWTSTIEEAIDSADSVIIFLSENSVNKEGFVQRELKRAWKRSTEKPENVIFLIPFRLDDCAVPRRLRSRHWGDYFGANKEKTYESLLVSLKQRHEQKLQLEAKEGARVEELLRTQKQEEDRIRREKDEALRKQAEERARQEAAEKARLEDIARKEAEAKIKAIAEEKQARRTQGEQTSPFVFSKYTGSSILIDHSIVHFESLGRGRPIIFLHGWVGSWRYWFRSMQVVSRSFRAYALDLWGFGDTAHNSLKYSLEQQATLLDLFFTEMGIGKVAIIGHGLGALVGMTFATRFPHLVDRLMAVSCPLDYVAVHTRLRTASPVELTEWLSNRTSEALTALSDAAKADNQAIAASLAGLQANNVFSSFRTLNIPCLLVYGERDPAITTPDGEYSLSTMTHQVELEGSGHFPMLDKSVLFDRLLMDFLMLPSGFSPRELQMRE
jgi:pimeloyl-ACP methyl ester carboxylesterase